MIDLYDRLQPLVDDMPPEGAADAADEPIKLAIVGVPNSVSPEVRSMSIVLAKWECCQDCWMTTADKAGHALAHHGQYVGSHQDLLYSRLTRVCGSCPA